MRETPILIDCNGGGIVCSDFCVQRATIDEQAGLLPGPVHGDVGVVAVEPARTEYEQAIGSHLVSKRSARLRLPLGPLIARCCQAL